MATKIGFKAKPLIDSGGVDWLSVGRNVVQTLTEQEEAREATRVKVQADYAADVKQMVETPLGKDAEANEWLTNGIASITGAAGMDNRLWKSGALSTKEYMRNRANRTQGTDLVLSAYKTYNKNYDAVMKGINDKSLAGEKMLFLKAQAESMFDFGKTGLYINPLNSEINVAKKQLVDGAYVMSDNPNEFLNASELMQAASAMYKGFDANTAAATLAESVGQRLIRDGFGNTIESAYMAVTGADNDTKSKIKQARLDQVRGILNNEDAGAYLTDTLNEGFSFTKDADEAATKNKVMSKMILLNQDGSTTLSKEQMDYAVDKFDTLLEVYLPKEKKAPLAPKAPQLTSGERTAQKEGEIGYGLALALTSGGAAAGESLQKIKANNNSIGNVYETDTSYVIQYNDGTSDKTIEKIMRDGVEARQETAVSLMAAVSPKYDATQAETAKQGYLKSNEIGERTEKGLFGERTAIAAENSSTYQTKSEVAKKDQGVSISEQIEKLPPPDEDNAGQVLDVIKDIYPLPGTESYIDQIQVTAVGVGIDDVLNFKLPEEFIPFVKDVGGVKVNGQNVKFEYDSKKDKVTLRNVIDGIIAGMYDVYNKSDARKTPEDNPDATPPEAGTTTTTAGGGAGELD